MKGRQWILVASGVCGILALVGAGLFVVAGAGWAGSPFQGGTYFNVTLFLVIILGPVAVLPCTILDYFKSGLGGLLLCGFAIADVIAIVLNNTRDWGFAIHDAGLGALCLAFPAFVIGTLLFFFSGRCDGRLKSIWQIELALAAVPAVYFSWHVGPDGLSAALSWLGGGTV
jgi:hypothetical protein